MIWEPSREFIERTNVWRFMQRLGFSDREAFLRFSRENPERFWDETMREMGVEWFVPYRQVLDASRGPEWAQWFVGGRLNIAHNCLDRWADSGRVACLWEAENGATREVTFRERAERSQSRGKWLARHGVTSWRPGGSVPARWSPKSSPSCMAVSRRD
jgi:acetyl-CoA synthetase